MRLSSSFALISLVVLIGCKTNQSPEPETDPASADAGPGLALAGDSGGDAPEVAVKEAPPMAEVLAQHGSLRYEATGGRSPFESISCSISWRDGGEGAMAKAMVKVRGDGSTIERETTFTEPELEAALERILVADPRAFPEANSPSRATDMHTYTLDVTLMGKKHSVESYGLSGGVPLAEMVKAMDDACAMKATIDAARTGGE